MGKTLAQNKKAYYEYFIEEKMEAGIVLTGTEIKSLRQGRCNLKESYARVENEEMLVYNMHISPYEQGNIFNTDPLRPKKLLLHKNEIRRLIGYIQRDGLTIIPLSIYLNSRGLAKMQIAVAKGKKNYDKRDSIAQKDANRKMDRIMKDRGRE